MTICTVFNEIYSYVANNYVQYTYRRWLWSLVKVSFYGKCANKFFFQWFTRLQIRCLSGLHRYDFWKKPSTPCFVITTEKNPFHSLSWNLFMFPSSLNQSVLKTLALVRTTQKSIRIWSNQKWNKQSNSDQLRVPFIF